MSEFVLQAGVIIVGAGWIILFFRLMGGTNPFTARLCDACQEMINDRAKVCPHCHTATGRA